MQLSAEDSRLLGAVKRNNADAAEAVQQAIRDGANVNAVRDDRTPLFHACRHGTDQIIRILLDAGADARWKDCDGWSATMAACYNGHLSTVQLLINHDNSLLELANDDGWTPLTVAIRQQHSDVVRFLLDTGADPHHGEDQFGFTALMRACQRGSHEIVRLLLAAGADVEARGSEQQTALHHAVKWGAIELLRQLILRYNANMYGVDRDGSTPFDLACRSNRTADVVDHLLEMYGNKLTQDHGSFGLHELLKVAEYSFAEERTFHPPLDPFRIILPLGKLTLKHFRTLLRNLDPELIRTRDDTGKLPIHVACHTNAPVEVLAMILKLDRNPTAALRIADFTGALPIHLLCGTTAATEYVSVRYLVEQGGVGTLAARNQQGASPLHVLCESVNPPIQAIQYLMQSFPGSVAMRTKAGEYPFMMASATSSLSVIYELVRANPGLVVPR